MVFGTFDGLHLGHLSFFKQARALSRRSSLIVSIARDKNVHKIKGRYPRLHEKKRLALLKENKLVHKAVLSGIKNYLPHILKEKPDIIALGYDQRAYVAELKKSLASKKLKVKIVRLKSYKPHIYKNHLLHVSKTKSNIKAKKWYCS